MHGNLIAIIGTSSVGKSSAAAGLQEILTDPHLVVGIDNFLNMFPQHWADHPRGPGPGMWYDDAIDPDGSPRARIRYGKAGERLLAGMRASVVAMLDCGNDIILDEMPLDRSIIPQWRQALSGYRTFWVRLTASLDVVEERESARRSGQHVGNARGHYSITEDAETDLVIDTSSMTSEEVALAIKHAM